MCFEFDFELGLFDFEFYWEFCFGECDLFFEWGEDDFVFYRSRVFLSEIWVESEVEF